jgi:hypothetical protein
MKKAKSTLGAKSKKELKNMKTVQLIICKCLLILITALFVGCDDTDKDKNTDSIVVRDETALYQAVYSNDTQCPYDVGFTTTGAWTSTVTDASQAAVASEPVTWISINPASGNAAGDYTVTINLEQNNAPSDRSAVITIVCGEATVEIRVIQTGALLLVFDVEQAKNLLAVTYNLLLKESYMMDAALTHQAALPETYDAFGNFTFDANTPVIETFYLRAYSVIRTAESILLNSVDADISESDEKELRLTALINKAYAGSVLLNYFGTAIMNAAPGSEEPQLTNTVQESINLIVAGINNVVASGDNLQKFHACQILSRVALNYGDFQTAYNTSKQIIESGAYSLDSNDFGVNLSLPASMQKDGDLSFQVRYVETLLLHAEAALGLERASEALQTLNQLEQWRGLSLTQTPETETVQAALAALWTTVLNKEGHEYARLKRTGAFLSALGQYGAQEKHKLLPIPRDFVNYYPSQNPGY